MGFCRFLVLTLFWGVVSGSVSLSASEEFPANKCRYSAGDQVALLKRWKFAEQLMNRLTGISKVHAALDAIDSQYASLNFWDAAVRHLRLKPKITSGDLASLGKEGEARLVIANHPTGLWDGIFIGYITEVLAGRKDVRILYNDTLTKLIPNIKDRAFELDISGKEGAARKNAESIRQAEQHLRNGGLLIVFPAGSVSSYQKRYNAQGKVVSHKKVIADAAWASTATQLAFDTGARVVPIFFEQTNSRLWHNLDRIDSLLMPDAKPLRLTFAMINELFRIPKDKDLGARIGESFSVSALLAQHRILKNSPDAAALTYFMRNKVYQLAEDNQLLQGPFRGMLKQLPEIEIRQRYLEDRDAALMPVPPQNFQNLKHEFKIITSDYIPSVSEAYHSLRKLQQQDKARSLVRVDASRENRDFEVILVQPQHINTNILNRIGYERNRTFEGVGEGNTARKVDIDPYDLIYNQVVLVDHKSESIVGAYRIGETKKLFEQYGPEGVYSQSFLRPPGDYYTKTQALDFGRSIVVPELQGSSALQVLWRGLAEFLVLNPQVSMLHGPVSISMAFSQTSMIALTGFFLRHSGTNKLSQLDIEHRLLLENFNPPDAYIPVRKLVAAANRGEIPPAVTKEMVNIMYGEHSFKEGIHLLEKFLFKTEMLVFVDRLSHDGHLSQQQAAAYKKLLNKTDLKDSEKEQIQDLKALVFANYGEAVEFLLSAPPLLKFYSSLVNATYNVANVDREFNTVDLAVNVPTNQIPAATFLIFLGKDKVKWKAYKEAQNKIYPGFHKD